MRDDFILHVPYKQSGVIQCGNEDWMINLGPSVSKDRDFTDTFGNDARIKTFLIFLPIIGTRTYRKGIKVNLK